MQTIKCVVVGDGAVGKVPSASFYAKWSSFAQQRLCFFTLLMAPLLGILVHSLAVHRPLLPLPLF